MTRKALIAQARQLACATPSAPWSDNVIWTLSALADELERAQQQLESTTALRA